VEILYCLLCAQGLWMWSSPVERLAADGSKYHLVRAAAALARAGGRHSRMPFMVRPSRTQSARVGHAARARQPLALGRLRGLRRCRNGRRPSGWQPRPTKP